MTGDAKKIPVSGYSLLSLAAGGALPLAFAPFEFYWLSPLLLALLFWLWLQVRSLRDSVWLGWLFGVGQFGVGTSWIQISTAQFGGVGLSLSLLITLLFISFLALFPAVLGALFHWLRYRFSMYAIVLLPLLWTLFEWFRSILFGGFPWLLLGHTAPDSFYRGLAPWVGTFGVTLFLAVLALLLLRVVINQEDRRVDLLWIFILLTLSWGSSMQQWGKPSGKPVSVALVQGNIPQQRKWLPEYLDPTLARYREATLESKSRLVIWPETAIPAFRQQVEAHFLTPLSEYLTERGQTLLAGVSLVEWKPRHYYNGAVMIGVDQGEYRKRHLVPLGEYMPLEEVLQPLLDFIKIPFSSFSHGAREQPLFQVDGVWLSTTICYEVAYPEITFSGLPQAGVLVTLSNDAWFGGSLAPDQHLQIARMRALESARPMLRATNTGITAVIGSDGKILQQLPRSEISTLEAVIQPMQGVTPYLYWSKELL